METEGFEPSSKQATKKLSTCLVFAYFSTQSRPKTAYLELSFLSFELLPKPQQFYVNFYDASKLTAANQGFQETFSLHTLCARAWTYYNSVIKQLKRNYFRRLYFEIDFNEYYFIARHAYNLIDLAVKTSRPQIFKEQVRKCSYIFKISKLANSYIS